MGDNSGSGLLDSSGCKEEEKEKNWKKRKESKVRENNRKLWENMMSLRVSLMVGIKTRISRARIWSN